MAVGFGITVGVWVVAYVSRLPMVQMGGQATILGMLAVIFTGGGLAARYSARGIWAAVGAGVLSGLLDLIVVGSLFHDLKPGDLAFAPSAAAWIGGSILLNTMVAAMGGLAGKAWPNAPRTEIHWASVFAFVLAGATFLLIAAGGFVTAFHAGLAVPDWPRSFGYNMFLFPLSLMQKDSGKFFEHAHRLMGSLVGLTSIALAIYITITQRRTWVKVLAWAILLGVSIQGLMGGLRVTEKSETLAIFHGAFAQVLFAAMALLATVTSRGFRDMATKESEGASIDRTMTAGLVGSLVLQLILGTIVRHTDYLLLLHITIAALVTLLVLACGVRAWGLHGELKPLRRSGIAVLMIMLLQITLGVLAVVFWTGATGETTEGSALLTTAHQVNGAMLLACSTVLCVWTWQLLKRV